MLKPIFAVVFCFLFCNAVQADTIDFWHVFYNRALFKKYNENDKRPEIVFRAADIKSTDTLTIKYFRDTPCSTCRTLISLEDSLQQVVVTSLGKGTYNPLPFPLADLLQAKRDSGREAVYFDVYYLEDLYWFKNYEKRLLFRIRIE